MKSTYLILSSLLYLSQTAAAVPSFQSNNLKARDASVYALNHKFAHPQVHPRADGPTCDKCDPFKCRSKQYRDKQDCKCKSCLPGTKPDPTRTLCIPEKSEDKPQDKPSDTPNNEDGDKKYREKKEARYKEALERYKESYKKAKNADQNKDDRSEEDKKKDSKKERIGKCLPLVAASMMSVGAGVKKRADNDYQYSINYFSEDVLENDDILTLWPSNLPRKARSLNKRFDFDSDEYIDECLSALDSPGWVTTSGASPWMPIGGGRRRSASWPEYIEPPPVTNTDVALVPRETGVIEYQFEKRANIKAIMQGIGRFIGKLVGWMSTRSLKRLDVLKQKGGFKIAEKGKGAKASDQKWAGNQISKSKNWRNCLEGKKFEKYA